MGIEDARATDEQLEAPAFEPLMTADQVAAALGVSRKFVYARAAEGVLPGFKLGARYRFRPADVRSVPTGPSRVARRAACAASAAPGASRKLSRFAGSDDSMSVQRVRRGVCQVRWREAGRGSPAHSVMVYATTDAEACRKADTIDAEIRNRKAGGERVISIVVDRPEPLTLAEFLPVWHAAYGKDLARKTQETYGFAWDKWWQVGWAAGC